MLKCKKMLKWMPSWSLGVLAACGPMPQTTVEDAIRGGREVRADEEIAAKTVVLFYIDKQNQVQPFCSGSILNQNTILTAAHCVKSSSIPHVFVAEGPQVRRGTVVAYKVKRLRVHPDYVANKKMIEIHQTGEPQPRLLNDPDLALLQLDANLHPARINNILSRDHTFQVDDQVDVAGYGVSTLVPFIDSGVGVLRVAEDVPVLEVHERDVILDQSGKSGGHGVCHGDSGGPAFVRVDGRLKLWGVNSAVSRSKAGHWTGRCDGDASIIDIRAYLSWISHTIKEMQAFDQAVTVRVPPASVPAH